MAGIELEGMEELLKKLEQMEKKGSKIENKALKESAKILERKIKSNVPVRTGNLRKSIKISGVKKNKEGKLVWVGDIDRKAAYGWVVEFGHTAQNGRDIPANPFMSRAFESKKNEVMGKIKDEIRKGLGI